MADGGARPSLRPPSPRSCFDRSGCRRAENKVPISWGGAGIVIDGDIFARRRPSATTNTGPDQDSTSHCGGPGAEVAAEGAQDQVSSERWSPGNDVLDYAGHPGSTRRRWHRCRTGTASPSTASAPTRCSGRWHASSAGPPGTRAGSHGPCREPHHRQSGLARPGTPAPVTRQQQTGRDDPRGVHRRSAHLCSSTSCCTPGHHHVDERDPGRPGSGSPGPGFVPTAAAGTCAPASPVTV